MNIITLTPEEIRTLTDLQAPIHFHKEFDLVYESQIPNVGMLFLQGEAKLIKKKKVLKILPYGSLIGLYHLIHNSPLPMGIKIGKNTSVLMIEKSLIGEAVNQKSGILYQIISSL